MKKVAVQNAIQMSGFRVIKCRFNSAGNITSDDFDDMIIDFQFATAFNAKEEKKYIIKFLLGVKSKNRGKIDLQVESVAFFETEQPINDEFKQSSFALLNSPAIAFPFLRSFVQTFSVNSGVPPIILPAMNFSKAEAVTDIINDNKAVKKKK